MLTCGSKQLQTITLGLSVSSTNLAKSKYPYGNVSKKCKHVGGSFLPQLCIPAVYTHQENWCYSSSLRAEFIP